MWSGARGRGSPGRSLTSRPTGGPPYGRTSGGYLEGSPRYALPMPDPAAVMRQLRDHALRATAEELDLAPTEARPRVWGALMELGYPTGIATLMALAEGTTSLYFSNGGGVIGAGEHGAVREAAEAFLDAVEARLADFPPVETTPRPR